MNDWRYWRVVIPMLLAYYLMLYYLWQFHATNNTINTAIRSFLISMGATVIIITGIRLFQRVRKIWLHGELNRLNIRPLLCLRCGYNLRGTPDDATACSECGHAIARITQENETKP